MNGPERSTTIEMTTTINAVIAIFSTRSIQNSSSGDIILRTSAMDWTHRDRHFRRYSSRLWLNSRRSCVWAARIRAGCRTGRRHKSDHSPRAARPRKARNPGFAAAPVSPRDFPRGTPDAPFSPGENPAQRQDETAACRARTRRRHAAARFGGLVSSLRPENVAVKGARFRLATARHRQLQMIEREATHADPLPHADPLSSSAASSPRPADRF